MAKLRKVALVVFGAIVLSTVAIQASDVVRNIDGNMVGLAIGGDDVCGEGAIQMHVASGALCVDVYEASAGETCPVLTPGSEVDTQHNMNDFACEPISQAEVLPWRFVSLQQAQQLCARVGKRLPNNDEWYALASGMGDQSGCVTDTSGVAQTGSTECETPAGLHDMVGNVWEWVDAEVVNGMYNNRPVPESGYVQLVDADGVVLETAAQENEEYGSDYAITADSGVFGMIRGGFYGSGEDAGLYAQNLAVSMSLKSTGVGFRCVRSI